MRGRPSLQLLPSGAILRPLSRPEQASLRTPRRATPHRCQAQPQARANHSACARSTGRECRRRTSLTSTGLTSTGLTSTALTSTGLTSHAGAGGLRGQRRCSVSSSCSARSRFPPCCSLHHSERPKTPPIPAVVKVVIPEGYTRAQIAALAHADGLNGSYLVASKRFSELHPSHYGAPAGTPNLEGLPVPSHL